MGVRHPPLDGVVGGEAAEDLLAVGAAHVADVQLAVLEHGEATT